MDRGNYEDNISVSIVTNAPQLTLQDAPTNTKVNIWGYELCNGAQWKDFLEVVNKLGKENEQLKQQLAEKQNTIDEINKEFVQTVHDWRTLCKKKDKEIAHLKDGLDMCKNIKRYDIGEMLIENAKLKQNQTQLAIQELEKVKEEFGLKSGWSSETDMCFDLEQFINQQIKELKGE